MRSGDDKKVGIHVLRHSFATSAEKWNDPISDFQELLGHANPAITERYTHVRTKNLKRFQAHWTESTVIWFNQSYSS
ncbi:site-specific recombinase XerD [Fontibacillus solani]|uniref:Site-specific recombinase XerD n=1 Tax=Fontibacillus solani TaxID=1572857 RepID=A0A7W3SZ10_9BACL|nr:tyrosine-type recombinase/integrase [Fontibacillus solani]MBA9088538.1 site-specific recombinase XerD [Fontibacillus solani]